MVASDERAGSKHRSNEGEERDAATVWISSSALRKRQAIWPWPYDPNPCPEIAITTALWTGAHAGESDSKTTKGTYSYNVGFWKVQNPISNFAIAGRGH